MDTTETTPEDLTTQEDSFATELGKNFAIAAATTAGMCAGLIAFGYVSDKLEQRRVRKAQDQEIHELINQQ